MAVSLKQIAEQAGVSRMTVSCALRKTGRINPETAKRIRQIARSLGYTPDARMAVRMEKVRDARHKDLVPLAWINANSNEHAYREWKWLSPYMEGAREHCADLGYKLDEFWLRKPGMSEARLSSIIAHRGISGIIVSPSSPDLSRLRFDWRRFAAVSFETAVLVPSLHRVVPDYHHNILLALKMLRRAGYRRIGLCIHAMEDRRSHHTYVAGLLYFHQGIRESERTPPFIYPAIDIAGMRAWIKREKPDVIVAHSAMIIDWINSAGLRVPEDIGVAHLAIEDDCADWAGIWQNKRRIGAQAIEQIVSMIQNNRIGLPDIAYETLIPGEWRHGKTLRNAR